MNTIFYEVNLDNRSQRLAKHLRYAWATRKLHTICCLHERDFVLWLSRRWNRPRVSDHGRERFLHRVAQKYNRHRKLQVLLTRQRFLPNAMMLKCGFKPHLHGRLFCNAIRRFFMRENLSRRAVTHTRRDLLAAIAFEKNRRRVSNTCDLRCRLYFARFDARIVLARDHLHKVDFNVSRVSGQSRARVNSKSYAIYESSRHSAMHKCFASRWLRLP